MRERAAAAVLVAALASCTLDDVDLADKRCPCAVGWACDPRTNRCVEELGSTDAGRDAAVPRDAAIDGRARDALSPMDARPSVDGGVDAPLGLDAPPGVDAPPVIDAGPDPTACDDTLVGATFCDGFEADDGLAAWTMTTGNGGASVSRTTAVAFRGEAALLAQSTTAGGYMQLKHDFGPVTSGELWMRGYMLVPSASPINHVDTFFLRSSTGPEYHGLVMTVTTELRPYLWVSELASAYRAPDPLVRDGWTCFEMHIAIGASGSTTLYVDGSLAAMATGIDTSPSGGYSLFAVGITWASSTQGATQLYFDEVAMGPSRLPCD